MCIGRCSEVCTYWAGQGAEGCFKPGRAEGIEHLFRGPLHRKGSGPPNRFSVCRVMTAKQQEYAKGSLLIFCWKMTFKDVEEDELLKRELGFIHTVFFPKESASQNNFLFRHTHKDFLLLPLLLQAEFAEDHQITYGRGQYRGFCDRAG